MKLLKIAATAAIALALTACGQRVTVAPNEVGKILTPNGYKESIIPTSTFKLDPCWSVCDKLVTLDSSDKEIKESIKLFMPKDKLEMSFDIRMVMAVNPDKYDQLFTKIPANKSETGGYYIPLETAYNTYASQIIRTVSREMMAQFSIAEVASNREVIGAQLSQRLMAEVEAKTPFIVRYAGLADVAYPTIITQAQEKAAERREQIATAEAESQKRMIELERDLLEAQKQRKIDVEKAQAEAEVNRILANSITPSYVKYKELEALKALAESQNKVFVPASMLDTVAGQVMVGGSK